jgi:hypothetical protein
MLPSSSDSSVNVAHKEETQCRSVRPSEITGVSIATFGALATSTAMATSASVAKPASSSAGHTEAIFCWKDYEFNRSGNTLIASAFKDCTNYEVPQALNVSIKKWYYDESGYSGWVTAASGQGVVTATCNPYRPTTYRHSITGEQIYC